jgi:RND family efflux transporter MFP subunit
MMQHNDKISGDTPKPRKPWWQRLVAVAIIVVLLIGGVLAYMYLLGTKPTAKRKPPAKMQALVTTMTVAPLTTNVHIKALGRIIPAQQITLQARVSGKVIALHPDFIPGGIVEKDALLVKLDDTDYQLALKNKLNELARTKADLRIEEGLQAVAEQEWQLIKGQSDDIDKSTIDLALRKPQLEKVQTDIDSAATEVERAEVDLARTEIKAPFNVIVREKNIDLGSQVSSQSLIATLIGIDVFWAEISIPADKLDWIVLPSGGKNGSAVTVYGNEGVSYKAEIVNLLPDVDPDGLMARLLVAVSDPMGLKTDREPLLLGSFVRAEIQGKEIENVIQVPRSSLHDTDTVLTVSDEETLHLQPVSVIWKNADLVFIDAGLQAGDRVVVSNVPAPIEGMLVTIVENGPEQERRAAEGRGYGRR